MFGWFPRAIGPGSPSGRGSQVDLLGRLHFQLSKIGCRAIQSRLASRCTACEVGAAFEDIAVIDGFDVQLSDERSPRGLVRVIRLFPRED